MRNFEPYLHPLTTHASRFWNTDSEKVVPLTSVWKIIEAEGMIINWANTANASIQSYDLTLASCNGANPLFCPSVSRRHHLVPLT